MPNGAPRCAAGRSLPHAGVSRAVTPEPPDHPGNLDTLSARSLLRTQFRIAHALLDDAIDRVPLAAVHRCRSGWNVSPGARYARALLCEDFSVNGVLDGGKPLALSTWAGRTGLSEIPPLAGTIDWRAWAYRVRLDRNTVRAYARAVYASTDAYIAALAEGALGLMRVETPMRLLNALLLSVSVQRGEIAGYGRLATR